MKLYHSAYLKLASFCNYQERCTIEVWQKMEDLEVPFEGKEFIINQLIKENLLNDLRYAQAIARGRFRYKHWGRLKIKYYLQQKKIPLSLINKAFEEITDEEYEATLIQLIENKAKGLATQNKLMLKAKIYNYAVGKGYESELVLQYIFKIIGN